MASVHVGQGADRCLHLELVVVKVAVDQGVLRVEAESGLGVGMGRGESGRYACCDWCLGQC